MADLSNTGVFQVNGAWATAVKFDAEIRDGKAHDIEARFLQGRAEIAQVKLTREQALELLGVRNVEAIDKRVMNAHQHDTRVSGTLRDKELAYGEATLGTASTRAEDNTVAMLRARMRNVANNEAAREAAGSGIASAIPDRDRTTADAPKPPSVGVHEADVEVRRRESARVRREAAERDPYAMPSHVADKFLAKGDKYYYDDKTLAFTDKGNKLTVAGENRDVIKDVFAVAKERGWEEVTVTGTKSFRKAAWQEGAVQGIVVAGYTPTQLEQQALNKVLAKQFGPNEVKQDTPVRTANRPASASSEQAPPARGTTTATPDARTTSVTAGQDQASAPTADPLPKPYTGNNPSQGVVYGRFVEQGEAPYRNDPTNRLSPYISVAGSAGKVHQHWGVDIPEALNHSQTKPVIGEQIGIRVVASQPVTLLEQGVGANGQPVTREIQTHRNLWVVEKAAYFEDPARLAGDVELRTQVASLGLSQKAAPARDEQEKVVPLEAKSAAAPVTSTPAAATPHDRQRDAAAAIRSAQLTREELQRNYPELSSAVFSQMAAHQSFAEAYVKAGLIRQEDRAEVIAIMRERLAGQIERGEKIPEVDRRTIGRTIERSIQRAVADNRNPQTNAATDRAVDQVMTPKPLVRGDDHVRA